MRTVHDTGTATAIGSKSIVELGVVTHTIHVYNFIHTYRVIHTYAKIDTHTHTLDWKRIHTVIQWELNPENMQPYKKEKK